MDKNNQQAKKKKTIRNDKGTPNHKERLSDKGLKPEHIQFVQEYLANGCVGYRAYQAVYPNVNYMSAAANSSKLLNNAKILALIKEGCAKIWDERDAEIAKAGTYQAVKALGESDISEVVDIENRTLTVKSLKDIPPHIRQAIKSIAYTRLDMEDRTTENIVVTMHDKLKALETRAKLQGLMKDKDPTQFDIIIKPAVRPDRPPDSVVVQVKEKNEDTGE